ncbi:MAG: nitrophenyl compound nitroreductase subunit ArsF family protein [Candidatus Kapaibacterium sp.]
MTGRKSIPFFLMVFFAMLVNMIFTIPSSAQDKSENVVKVYYFHGEVRCATCTKIENLIADAMDNKFKKLIASGKLQFKVINYNEQKNSIYEKKYDLYSQTLIISRIKNGKETKWKSAEKIWTLHSNKKKFIDYVASEISDYLKGL